jgi:hypothetical protein
MTLPSLIAPRRRRLAWLALLPAVALLLAGCFRTELSIEVNEDGSGVIGFVVALDRSMTDFFASFEDDEDFDFTADLMNEFEDEDLPPGSTVEPYETDDAVGVRVRMPFGPGDDVAQSIEQVFDSATGGEGFADDDDGIEHFVLQRDGDRWIFEADMTMGDDALGEEFADPFARAMFGDAAFVWRVKLPGEVIEHNADQLQDDGTLVWNLDLFSTDTRQMRAITDVSSGGDGALSFLDVGGLSGEWVAAIIVGVVALLVVIAAWLATRPTRP